MKRPGLVGACWPDDLQEAVLRAAVLPPDRAVPAWRDLRADLDLDDLWDAEIHRLLPLVFTNLRHEPGALDDADRPRLKGLYRRTWYENQVLIAAAVPWLARLRAAGVPVLLLKGVPLGLLTYGDLGRRPMHDVDVLVPIELADHALDQLEAWGWRDAGGLSRDRLWRRYHGANLRHPDGGELDVHWFVGDEFVLPDRPLASGDGFWTRARPLTVGGLDLLALDPTDTLVHQCVHGTWAGSSATVRWAADAATVVAVHGDDLDWDRVVELARTYRMVPALTNALTWLATRLDQPIPAGVLERLRASPTTARERRLHRTGAGPVGGPEVLGGLPHLRAYRAHLAQGWTPARARRELPGFLEDLWGLDRARSIPLDAARKAGRRLRAAVRG